MQILYDSQCFDMQIFGGISMYHANLYSEITKLADAKISLRETSNSHLLEFYPNLINSQNNKKKVFDRTYSKYLYELFHSRNVVSRRLYNQYYGFDLLRESNFDIFHPTYYDLSFTKYCDSDFVITLHDFIPELYAVHVARQEKLIENKKIIAEKASKIIAISEETKKDAIRLLNIDSNKIVVVYHGFSQKYRPLKINASSLNLPPRYILYVGGRGGYKNFNLFLSAFAVLNNKNKDLFLVCTGKPFNNEENTLIHKYNISNSVICSFFSDELMPTVYNNALFFVFPSLYEGFGLPILEAFYASCPVALSDIPVFREIASNAALYFDPNDKSNMVNVFQDLLSNNHLRSELKFNGLKRSTYFSWEKCARETFSVYKSCLENNI